MWSHGSRIPTRRAGLIAALAVAGLAAPLVPAVAMSYTAAANQRVTVASAPVVLVRGGQTVRLPVRVTTADGAALQSPVSVLVRTGAGTATPGSDYRPLAEFLTFPAGTQSGSTRTVGLATMAGAAPEVAENVPVTMTAVPGAGRSVVRAESGLVVLDAHGLPYLDASRPVNARVADLMARMTLADEVGQMTQAERASVDADQGLITTWGLGSLLSGGGSTPAINTPTAWADMIDGYQRRALAAPLQIPLIYGIDSVHGDGNLVGATIFPHNIGIGASRRPGLAFAEERVVAAETRATGIPWVFAPCLCVARDTRWGRTYESYGEDPALVESMETAIAGFQGNGKELARPDLVLATAKHFAGDGATRYGTGDSGYPIDQGVAIMSRAEFARLALEPYRLAVQTYHVGSVMPSYSSVDFTDDGLGNPVKMHADRALISGWLKDRIGFNGFVISDYNGIDQIPGDYSSDIRTSVNAGIDMVMAPSSYQDFETKLLAEVQAGRVSRYRIDVAVSRILTQKFGLGLFERPFADRTGIPAIGSPEHRAVARKAAAASQVLLKNTGGVLPLRPDAKLYVAGRSADDLGNQTGGWTVSWQGGSGNRIPGTTILAGIREVAPAAQVTYSADGSASVGDAQVGVVVVGETPYSEGFGDVGGPQWAYDPWDNGVPREPKQLTLQDGDQAVVARVCAAVPRCVVLVVSGRPQIVTGQIRSIDALVASWLPGSEGEGVADTLFGRRPFTGQLPQSWPRSAAQEPINVGDASYAPLYPFGWGLQTGAGAPTTSVLGQARATLAAHSRAVPDDLVTTLRLVVQQVLDPTGRGVPVASADRFARADVAFLQGRNREALSLLLAAATSTG